MKAFLPLFLLFITCSVLTAQHHHGCPLANDAKLKALLEEHRKIFAGAKNLKIYEGLPHPYEEEETFKAESKRKDVVKLPPLDEAFYTPVVQATNTEQIIKLLSGPDGIRINSPKKCGFHSDYCIQFTSGGMTYRAFACFGCVELFIINAEDEQGHTFNFNSKELGKLLAIYDKKRPKKKKAE